MSNFILSKNALDINSIYNTWYNKALTNNHGAFLSFCGIVRQEGQITGLSFELYEALLKAWFDKYQARYKEAELFFAHSFDEVLVGQSSYLAAVSSKNRQLGLKLINDFVEDFKRNAPIWKYDVVNNQKTYKLDRAFKLNGAGILC